MPDRPLAIVVLAAGAGRRMRSSLPKSLHPVAGRPALLHVLDAAQGLHPDRIVVVTKPDSEAISVALRDAFPDAETAIQPQPRGTADAVEIACKALGALSGQVLVLCGDTPLLTSGTLARFRAGFDETPEAAIAILAFHANNPTGYGRLRIDTSDRVEAIVEHRDASEELRKSTLCNGGALLARMDVLPDILRRIRADNAAGERYLTDAVALARNDGASCIWMECPETELLGFNTRQDLARVENTMQDRLRAHAMEEGATLVDPASVWFSHDTRLGPDTRVEPHVIFGPGVRVGEGTEILGFSRLEGAITGAQARIGPHARLRPGTVLGERVRIGNFVEVKNSIIGNGTRINHLAYVGDARVGEGVNIGAGTIFCNFDGSTKHQTIVGAEAFIGSNSALVAPLIVGPGARIGAGSTVTRDVPAGTLSVARARERQIPNRRFPPSRPH